MLTTADKRAAFRKLHETGCFIIPNPFDVGSAKALQHLGFKALASTSAGFAWTLGKADNKLTVDDVCNHLAAISAAVDIPVNADFEDGFAHEPEKVARQRRARGEDRHRPASRSRILPATTQSRCSIARSRSSASRRRARRSMPTSQRRLPHRPLRGVSARREGPESGDRPPHGLCRSRRGLPLCAGHLDQGRNLGGREGRASEAGQSPGRLGRPSLADADALGVRRISVGGSLARMAWAGFMKASKEMADKGTFGEFANGYSGGELNKMFS